MIYWLSENAYKITITSRPFAPLARPAVKKCDWHLSSQPKKRGVRISVRQ